MIWFIISVHGTKAAHGAFRSVVSRGSAGQFSRLQAWWRDAEPGLHHLLPPRRPPWVPLNLSDLDEASLHRVLSSAAMAARYQRDGSDPARCRTPSRGAALVARRHRVSVR